MVLGTGAPNFWSLASAQQASFALRVQHSQEGQRSEGNSNDIKELLGTTRFQLRKPLALGYQTGWEPKLKWSFDWYHIISYHPLGSVHYQFSLEDTIENQTASSKLGCALGFCVQFLRALCCSIMFN